MATPQISVVMPVYNGERFLEEAVESILNQTFRDFELIAINDGSTDRSGEMLDEYERRDTRVRILRQPSNQGLVAALNWGCQEAQGQYIVRMDADDISLPERLQKQVDFMNMNPEVGIAGTWIEYIDEHGIQDGRTWKPPTSHILLLWKLLFGAPMAHPTWIMRRKVAAQLNFYSKTSVEDFDLLMRAIHVTHMGNLPEILLRYRFWSKSKSTIFAREEAPIWGHILQEAYASLFNIPISVEEGVTLLHLIGGQRLPEIGSKEIRRAGEIILMLSNAFLDKFVSEAAHRKAIQRDTAVKLWTLAAIVMRTSLADAISFGIQATRLYPTAIGQFLVKVLKKFLSVK
jgi:glycosyltransferase involved in cell wall biosynthesis